MIIWLASYPKSGNTWVRLFLNKLLYSKNIPLDINNIQIQQFPNKKHFNSFVNDLGSINELVQNYTNAQAFINLDKKIKLLKTHSANWTSGNYKFTNYENTLGTIYIVRDPRNVITSIKNHYSKNDYEDALSFMINKKKFIGSRYVKEEFNIPVLISSWSNHYNSWKKLNKNYILIKYENLLSDPMKEFNKISNFIEKKIKRNFSDEDIKSSIDSCNFSELQKQEEKMGFIESPRMNSNKFFFLGPKNDWQRILDVKISKRIETLFKKEMIELGYL